MMEVCIQNSGPVTLEIESPAKSIRNNDNVNVDNEKVSDWNIYVLQQNNGSINLC